MSTYLILGGTGKTGRRLTTQLTAAGHEARAASRHPAPGGVRFDWADRATWDTALAGAEGVYVVGPALELDFAGPLAAFLDRAATLGVRRAALLSARGADADASSPLRVAELAALGSALPPTILRPTWFAQNLTEGDFRPDASGAVAVPAGSGGTAFIDTEDIAAVAAAVLTTDGHAGQAYDMSGPEALTWQQAVATLAEAGGRPLTYVDVDPAAWVRGAIGLGIPEDYAGLLGFLFQLVRDGHEAYTSDGVQRVLGRAPTAFAEVARREAAAAHATA